MTDQKKLQYKLLLMGVHMFRFSLLFIFALSSGFVYSEEECDSDYDDCEAEVQKTPEQKAKEEAEAKALEELINKPFQFAEVRKVNLKKEEIITHAASFIAEKFVSGKSVIQINDPQNGKISGNIIIKDPKSNFFHYFHYLQCHLIIEAKDGRFRMQAKGVKALDAKMKLHNLTPSSNDVDGGNKGRIKPMAYRMLNDFLDEFEKYLKTAKKDTNW